MNENEGGNRFEVLKKADETFPDKIFISKLIRNLINPRFSKESIGWLVHSECLLREFSNIAAFDETLRYYGPSLHIVGEESWRFPFTDYQKIFPNLQEEDV